LLLEDMMTGLLSGHLAKLLVKLLLGFGTVFHEGKPLKNVRITHEEVDWFSGYYYYPLGKLFKKIDAEKFWVITSASSPRQN
jgi:hypothetical protein